MDEPKVLYAFACGLPDGGDADRFLEALKSLLVPEETHRSMDIDGHLLQYRNGSLWFACAPDTQNQSRFAQRVAEAYGAPIELLQVVIDFSYVDGATEDQEDSALPEGAGQALRFTVQPSGSQTPKLCETDDEEFYMHGDGYETVQAELWNRFDRDGCVKRTWIHGTVRPDPKALGLPARLVELRELMERANGFEIVEVSGRKAIRISLDGQRRLAFLSEDELTLLTANTNLAPTP